MDALLRRLARTGFRRAVAGEHWAWWVIAGAAFVLRRARQRDVPTTTINLRHGERWVVQVLRPEEAAARGEPPTVHGAMVAFDAVGDRSGAR